MNVRVNVSLLVLWWMSGCATSVGASGFSYFLLLLSLCFLLKRETLMCVSARVRAGGQGEARGADGGVRGAGRDGLTGW